jgi:hypothetical protein
MVYILKKNPEMMVGFIKIERLASHLRHLANKGKIIEYCKAYSVNHFQAYIVKLL